MGRREDEQPDGGGPFGSSPADWAIPGVDRAPVDPVDSVDSVDSVAPPASPNAEPNPMPGTTVPSPPSPPAAPRRRLMLPATDDLPEAQPGVEAPDVLAGLELLRAGAALVQAGTLAGFTASQKRAVVEALARVTCSVDAGYLKALGELDADPEAVPSASRHVGATFLKHRLNASGGDAARDVAAARALFGGDAGLALMGAAFAGGEVTRSHADVAVRCLNRIPRHLRDGVDDAGITGAAKVDRFLVEQSRAFAPSTTDRLARELLAVLDPDGSDRYDPEAFQRRSFSYRTDSTGMLVGKFQLAPAEGAVVRAAIEAIVRTSRARVEGETADGQRVLFGDDRSLGQQRADAVTSLCANYLRGGGLFTGATDTAGAGSGQACGCGKSRVGAPLTRVIVVATPDQVAAARAAIPLPRDTDDGSGHVIRPPGAPPPGATRPHAPPGLATEVSTGPLDPGAFGRLLCDAVEQAALVDENRQVLYLGRSTRLASAAQRMALIARDRGCVVPGCTVPPSSCDAHHTKWWRHGGNTDIDNLALVCSRHHTLIHTGDWELAIRDGVPWVTPPSWVDPLRRPVRNTAFAAQDHARTLGQALRQGTQPYLGFDAP